MPMTINTQGLDELSDMISKLGDKAEGVAAQALYDGAGIVADAFSKAANSIRTESSRGKRTTGFRWSAKSYIMEE